MMRSFTALAVLVFLSTSSPAAAQLHRQVDVPPTDREAPVEFDRDDLSGPRFGVTYVIGSGEIADRLADEDMERAISQFGWHFERRITPHGGGPQFVLEAIPLIGGVEYGTLVPNLTGAMGVRFPSGWEFGIGPNVIAIAGDGDPELQTSLVTAAGYTFRYSGVNLPVNVALAHNPEGTRLSLVFGYAIRR